MRVALVHHWFVSEGGGEHVFESMARMFPDADIFALVADPEFVPAGLKGHKLSVSMLSRIPFSRRLHRQFLPLYPLAVENLDLRGYDLVISSDAGPVKGVITSPEAVHFCYCHSPMRYLWNQYHEYYDHMPRLARLPFALSSHYVRSWDYAAAQRVTSFLANSECVSARIRQYYARSSQVLYPPVDTARAPELTNPGEHYLSAGRLVPYKRVDLLIEACNHLGRKLRIIGTGPEEASLRAMAGPTIEFLGRVDSDTLWREYARCRALLVASDEDFGMVSVEAQACGRPVIAYGKGGSLETVRSGACICSHELATGIFFYEQSARSVMQAIRKFEEVESRFVPTLIREWTHQFDTSCFERGLRRIVDRALDSRLTHAVR